MSPKKSKKRKNIDKSVGLEKKSSLMNNVQDIQDQLLIAKVENDYEADIESL